MDFQSKLSADVFDEVGARDGCVGRLVRMESRISNTPLTAL